MDGKAALQLIDRLLEQHRQARLRDIQRVVLLGVWERKSYGNIGEELGYDPDYIKQVASHLWKLLSQLTGERVSKGNILSVLQSQGSPHIVDWGEAIDVPQFYGREEDFESLSHWILDDRCRLVGIFGFGGIGKTTLSVKLSQQLHEDFDCVVWRTLRQAPLPNDLLHEILPILTGFEAQEISISSLMQHLRQKRCLLVLDNVESILKPGARSGNYLPGYEAYGQILDRVADEDHQSCLILTGREKPNGIAPREGNNLPVRSLQLAGLSIDAAQYILRDKGIIAPPNQQHSLINYFSGNPLAVKIAAPVIRNLFSGDIQAFLNQGVVFGDLWKLLNQQFERLSTLQKQVMYWLAINRESVTPAKLQTKLLGSTTFAQLLEALETLHERSLIETNQRGLTQQPVIMEYVTEQFVQQITREITSTELQFLKTHTIIEAQTKDYLREAQIQLILKPLVTRLLTYFVGRIALEEHLGNILPTFQHQSDTYTGYAVGNFINLFCHLQTDLTGWDFSHLFIRQAFLLNTLLHDVDFTGSHISQTVFTETFGDILGISFSPDGRCLATSDNKGSIQIWDVNSFEQKVCCAGHQHWAWDVSFSPDSQYLASVGDDYSIKLWDVATGERLYVYTGHTRSVNAVVFSPNGQIIASCSQDCSIRLWQVFPDANPEIHTLLGHGSRVWSIAFSPDGRILASGSEDHTVRLWDVATGDCLGSWQAHENWVRSVSFSPDGRLLATCSYDRTIKIWACPEVGSMDGATPEPLYVLRGHQQTVSAIAFSPNGQQLVSSSFDRSIKLWDVETGKCLKTLQGHRDRVWQVAFHPNGKLIGSGGDDHSTKIWDLDLGRCINTIVGHANAVVALAVNPDCDYLAGGYEDTTIRIWDIKTGKITRNLREHTNRIWSVKFSPAGNLLASSSGDYTIKLWDWQTERCLQTLEGHKSWVWMVAFNPNGTILASSSYDKTLKLWDVETGACVQTLLGHSSPAVSIDFSPNGQLLVSSGFDGVIKLWDSHSGECHQSLQEHNDSVWSVVFSSDGRWLISSSYDQTLKLWDVDTGACLRTFRGHQGPILKARFSPDDRFVISGGLDSTLKIWDVQTGECLQTLEGHSGLVYALDVAKVRLSATDDRLLTVFSGSFDETIKVWDMQTSECLATWKPLRPYEGMKIRNVQGLTTAQEDTLRALGAINH
jgi:WD40 repeat protein